MLSTVWPAELLLADAPRHPPNTKARISHSSDCSLRACAILLKVSYMRQARVQ